LEAALARLARAEVRIAALSPWYESAPVPPSDQPWYVNAVALIDTELDPAALLSLLQETEKSFGRRRRVRNEARAIDLDLLAYEDVVNLGPEPPLLPHPRLAERAFVLMPLADLLPDWRHPRTGRTVGGMIAALPPGQALRRMEAGPKPG
jgi:2-amino-4-hydroxy-6-hydroxymethyldihydropteridine diphosphokinase